MGEIVGKATSICVQKNAEPRGVYEKYLDLLKQMLGAKRPSGQPGL